jgi:hypothetical protein
MKMRDLSKVEMDSQGEKGTDLGRRPGRCDPRNTCTVS